MKRMLASLQFTWNCEETDMRTRASLDLRIRQTCRKPKIWTPGIMACAAVGEWLLNTLSPLTPASHFCDSLTRRRSSMWWLSLDPIFTLENYCGRSCLPRFLGHLRVFFGAFLPASPRPKERGEASHTPRWI